MAKRLVNKLIRVIQDVLIRLLLFIVYIIGLGLTKIVLMVFKCSFFKNRNRPCGSFWVTVQDDATDIKECETES